MTIKHTSPSIKDRHDAYLAVCKMKLSMAHRCRILSEVFSWHDGAWRVVGITKAALAVFQKNDFKKVSKMGINRSHLRDRIDTYMNMLNNPILDADQWWDYYTDNDRTIFSTASENMSDRAVDDIIWFTSGQLKSEKEGKTLFQTQGYAWRHTKEETAFLKELYVQHRCNID